MMARMDSPPVQEKTSATTLPELAALFTKLGFTAFGGPAAHVALMEDEVVVRRGWIDHQHFLDLVAAVNFIPGPNSTELAIHIGQLRAGFRGLLVAGACFITPAVLIILPIAWAYARWGTLPRAQPPLRAIGAAIAGVVLFATLRFGRTTLKDAFSMVVATIVAISTVLLPRTNIALQPEIPALILAAIAGAIWHRRRAFGASLMLALPMGFWPDMLRMAGAFLKIGATLFGSGYVLISYLQSGFVDRHGWLTQRELLDAIAVGQFTPGPLLTTASFVGYLLGHSKFRGGVSGGIIGGVVATLAIFSPSFILVAIFGPLLQKIRQMPAARGALDGMNAAVVGLMVVVALRLTAAAVWQSDAGRVGWVSVALLVLSLIALSRKINTTWIILAAGAVGLIIS
jgi:chromate transporter